MIRLRPEPPLPVEVYLARLDAELRRVPWRRARVLSEARDHLLEATDRAMAGGLSRSDAQAVAVEEFGSTADLMSAEMRSANPFERLLSRFVSVFMGSGGADASYQGGVRRTWLGREETRRRLIYELGSIPVGDRWAILRGLLRPNAVLVGGWTANGHRCCPLMAGAWETLNREPRDADDLAAAGLEIYARSFYPAFDDWARAWSFEALDEDNEIILSYRGRRALLALIEESLASDRLIRRPVLSSARSVST